MIDLLTVFDLIKNHGIGFVVILGLIARWVWLEWGRVKMIVADHTGKTKIDDLHAAALDPDDDNHKELISRSAIMDCLYGIEERIAEKMCAGECHFHAEMLKLAQATQNDMAEFKTGGEQAREKTQALFEEIRSTVDRMEHHIANGSSDIKDLTHELLVLVGRLINGRSKGSTES